MHEDIDVGIRFGNGAYPELDTVFLFSFDLIPVCSPDLMRQGDGLRNVSDLKNFTLLHSNYAGLDAGWPDWAMWLKVVDAEDVDASHGIYFNQSDLLFQAAMDGQGGCAGSTTGSCTGPKPGTARRPCSYLPWRSRRSFPFRRIRC